MSAPGSPRLPDAVRRLLPLLFAICLCLPAGAQFRVDTGVRDFVQNDLRKGAPFYDIGFVGRFVPSTMHMGLGFVGRPVSTMTSTLVAPP